MVGVKDLGNGRSIGTGQDVFLRDYHGLSDVGYNFARGTNVGCVNARLHISLAIIRLRKLT